jgi:hypothetical protein
MSLGETLAGRRELGRRAAGDANSPRGRGLFSACGFDSMLNFHFIRVSQRLRRRPTTDTGWGTVDRGEYRCICGRGGGWRSEL